MARFRRRPVEFASEVEAFSWDGSWSTAVKIEAWVGDRGRVWVSCLADGLLEMRLVRSFIGDSLNVALGDVVVFRPDCAPEVVKAAVFDRTYEPAPDRAPEREFDIPTTYSPTPMPVHNGPPIADPGRTHGVRD